MLNLTLFDLAPVPNFTAVIFVAAGTFVLIVGFGLLAAYLVRRAVRKKEKDANNTKDKDTENK